MYLPTDVSTSGCFRQQKLPPAGASSSGVYCPRKSPLLPSSYRPITLLNCDYKLISKLDNNTMKRFLKTLTHSDQSGFVKGRYIGDNIRLLYDIIDYTEFKQLLRAVLFVDFFKAFDSLQWEFLFKVFKKIWI